MNFISRPLIALTLILSFSAALAGGTADYGVMGISPATTAPASTTTSGK